MKSVVPKKERVQHRPAPRTNERRLVTQHPRRRILSLAAGAAALPAVSRMAWAQAYPSRPVRIIVGFAAGGRSALPSGRRVECDRHKWRRDGWCLPSVQFPTKFAMAVNLKAG